MRHALAMAAAALLLLASAPLVTSMLLETTPVQAHHVPVAAAVSDSDHAAHVAFLEEYLAQRAIVIDTVQLYNAATSGEEKLDVLLLLESALNATIDHLNSMDVRACFAVIARLSVEEFETAAEGFRLAGSDPMASQMLLIRAGALYSLLKNDVFRGLYECSTDGVIPPQPNAA